MDNEQFEEIQSEASDLSPFLAEAVQHLTSAESCETPQDLKANLLELRRTLKGAIDDIDGLLKSLKKV